jgi:hypothetical protein
MRHFPALLFVGVVLSSCASSRVALPTPPPLTAPETERRQALLDLAPTSQLDVVGVRHGVVVSQATAFLMLGNGLRVEDPRDLVAAVLPKSATAQYADEFDQHFDTAGKAFFVELIGLGAGLLLGTIGLSMGLSRLVWDAPPSFHYTVVPGDGVPFAVSGGVGLGVGFVAMFVSLIQMGQAQKAKESAFLAYPMDLQRRLGFIPVPASVPVAPPLPEDAPTSL